MENDHLLTLQNTSASTKSLLENCDKALNDPPAGNPFATTPAPTTTTTTSPNPLALLSDASSILKAQTTKLSLLILNKPFTPSAITYILTSLSTSCIPALVTALELCPPTTYSAFFHQHIRTLLSRAFRALSALLSTIPHDDERSGSAARFNDRDTLAATGQLWETCDEMSKVASSGLNTLAIERLDTYHSLLKDAIAELEEWDPNEEDMDTDTDSNQDPDSEQPLAQSSSTTTSPSQIPHLLALTLRLLRHIRLLYPALRKRRLRPFPPLPHSSNSSSPSHSSASPTLTSTSPSPPPPTPSQIHLFDTLLTSLATFSTEADEIAAALYARDETELLRRLMFLKGHAHACVQDVVDDWNGAQDEFSVWAGKWIGVVGGMDLDLDLGLRGGNKEVGGKAMEELSGGKARDRPAIATAISTELPIR